MTAKVRSKSLRRVNMAVLLLPCLRGARARTTREPFGAPPTASERSRRQKFVGPLATRDSALDGDAGACGLPAISRSPLPDPRHLTEFRALAHLLGTGSRG